LKEVGISEVEEAWQKRDPTGTDCSSGALPILMGLLQIAISGNHLLMLRRISCFFYRKRLKNALNLCNDSEEDRRWFTEAMQSQSVDVIKRMKEITLVMQTPEQVLESQGVTPADIEGTLCWVLMIWICNYLCNELVLWQICWMSCKNMLSPLTWPMVRFVLVYLGNLNYPLVSHLLSYFISQVGFVIYLFIVVLCISKLLI
jgi:hypothetical protein